MASELRTLKLQLLADTEDFIKGLKSAENNTADFSDKVGGYLKVGAAAFIGMATAVGTAAIAIGIDAVKAAAADQDATEKLDLAIRNMTGATHKQIAAVNDYIDATELATGINDDQLRASLERLLRSTGDITEAQKLQGLAMNIAAGTGKDLASVSDALGRAQDGQYKGLKDLGIELTTSIKTTRTAKVSKEDLAKADNRVEASTFRITKATDAYNKALAKHGADSAEAKEAANKLEAAQLSGQGAADKYAEMTDKVGKKITSTKDVAVPFTDIVDQLNKKFDGQAQLQAESYAGQVARIGAAFNQTKEQLGAALLPTLELLLTKFREDILPIIKDFVNGLTGDKPESMKNAIKFASGRIDDLSHDNLDSGGTEGYSMGASLRRLVITLGDLNKALFGSSDSKSGLQQMLDGLTAMVNAINAVIKPFIALIELSRGFAENAKTFRVPDWIAKLNLNGVPDFLLTPQQQSQKNQMNSAASFQISVYGALDPAASARAMQQVLTNGTRLGVI